jgi:hypothetical protein
MGCLVLMLPATTGTYLGITILILPRFHLFCCLLLFVWRLLLCGDRAFVHVTRRFRSGCYYLCTCHQAGGSVPAFLVVEVFWSCLF